MRLSDFDYELPKELIAQHPLKNRDEARLLVLDRQKQSIKHCVFRDTLGYLRENDLIVLNDTKVLNSRLKGRRASGGKIEVLLLRHKYDMTFSALIRPGRVRIGEKIFFDATASYATLSARNELSFNFKDIASVYRLGSLPLPPYIKREPDEADDIYYQTVYADKEGAIASPTAGLHFTLELLEKIRQSRINLAYVTLHVGYGTFKPVTLEDITTHAMEPEYFSIPRETALFMKKTESGGGRIFAVGTTSMRALETYFLGIKEGYTDLFIYPGFKFNAVSSLLTNFHLPKTTLYMLVCAFAGKELVRQAYAEAIEKRYRFYSYGDAMLII